APAGADAPRGRALAALSFGALGVVYGDIGTSPLYALKEAFAGRLGLAPNPADVLGVLSLVFWALTLVISLKYIGFILRADNHGEGGILALLALVAPKSHKGRLGAVAAAGLFGAALLYGDGLITPAISVLGAMEGLELATPGITPAVPWLAAVVIVLLFSMQKRGTERVGRLFGPIMAVWFAAITILGVRGILAHPAVLGAVWPGHALRFFGEHGLAGLAVLGAVVLVVTGGEALYADMGHFGRRPIRLAWFGVVFPALLLNYFGQGAWLLEHPEAARNPFFALAPRWALYPMIAVATLAATVASQALISGAYSLTRQAIQLGLCPRLTVVHTSETQYGQIYMPEVNRALAVGCLALVAGFRTSGALAAAYGIAVTLTMVITAILFHRLMREGWKWSAAAAGGLTLLFLAVDIPLFAANVHKIPDGGWFPLVVAGGVFVLMATWKRGRALLADIMRRNTLPVDLFLEDIARTPPTRVPGTAVFMTSDPEGIPAVMLHHLKHNKVLHQRVLLMSVMTEAVPRVPEAERDTLKELGQGFHQVVARYGFMETPDIPALLRGLTEHGLEVKLPETSFYLGRETLILTPRKTMAGWRKRIFAVLTRNARSATAFFGLPPGRVVELGAQIQF
ncbi:MAG TPA: potassium transporter Kup, partial [Gemmatimonadales bacterium]|nr:potassium transporter Kup [Gemmatimonadales bacterium]